MKERPYADFGSRFAAALLDGVILSIVGIIVGFVLGAILGKDGPKFIPFILQTAIAWFYYAYLESSPKQATIGKQALKIIVTDIDGNPISFSKATIRYFSKWISGLILLIGYIMAAFTEKKQALHDIIAGTLVVKE